jgi:DNA-binding CsgD family transcriptional regulator
VNRQAPAVDRLTPTELALLQAFADGLTSYEASLAADMSYCTVRTHRQRILNKLHCPNITSAVMLAARSGVIEA